MMIVFASAGISLFAKGNWGADRTKTYAFETGHTGNVTGIIADTNGKAFFSCGKDGSVIKWSENGGCEKYQLSSYEITGIAKNPAGTDFVVAETDGNDINAITVFDKETVKYIIDDLLRRGVLATNLSKKVKIKVELFKMT